MPMSNRSVSKKDKSRKLMYVTSVFFGFLAFFVIILGYRNMKRKIKSRVFFDRQITASTRPVDTSFSRAGITLYPRGTLRYSTFTPGKYFLEGIARFRAERPVDIGTSGGNIRLLQGTALLYASRFPIIFLENGALVYNRDTLRGHLLFYDTRKTPETLNINLPSGPYLMFHRTDSTRVLYFLTRTGQTGKLRTLQKNDSTNTYSGIIRLTE